MTKHDYIALAKIIKGTTDNLGGELEHNAPNDFWIHRDPFLSNLCPYLKSDNPNFNESKFREACGG